jgi:hypothetical protein
VIARRPNHPSALVPPNGYDSEAAQTASLRNPRRVAKRVGVMFRGRWQPVSELVRMPDVIAASYKTNNQK